MTVSPSTATREAGTSQPARRRARRRPSLSHVLIVLAAVAAFVLNYLALQDRDQSVMVAVADRAVSGGSPLSLDDIRFVPIESGFEAVDSLLSEPAFADREGWVATRPIGEGELIALGDLIEPGVRGDLRSMSLPIAVEHAAGGILMTGDRVDVISVTDGVPSYVVADVEVISVPADTGSSIGGFGDYHVVVAVDDQQALRLAAALDSGSLEIVRSTGAGAVGSTGEDGDS